MHNYFTLHVNEQRLIYREAPGQNFDVGGSFEQAKDAVDNGLMDIVTEKLTSPDDLNRYASQGADNAAGAAISGSMELMDMIKDADSISDLVDAGAFVPKIGVSAGLNALRPAASDIAREYGAQQGKGYTPGVLKETRVGSWAENKGKMKGHNAANEGVDGMVMTAFKYIDGMSSWFKRLLPNKSWKNNNKGGPTFKEKLFS